MTSTAQHHGLRLANLGLAAAIISRVFGRLVGIVLVVLLAREAEPDTIAVYGYLLGAATLVATLTDLGVAAVAGREVAAGRLPADGALHAALPPHSFSLAVAAAVLVCLTVFAGPDDVPPSALALTVVFVLVGGMVNLWSELLRATGRVMFEGGLQAGSAVALVIGGVLVINNGGDATDLLMIVVLKEALVLVVAICIIPPRRRSAAKTRDLLKESIWLAIAGTALILLWRQGTVVIGAVGTVGALATYVVASRFLDAGVTIAHSAGFGLVPGMSALASDAGSFRRATRRYIALAFVIGVTIAVVGLAAATPLTVIPFGERWAEAVPAVRLMAVAALPILLSFVAFPVLLARRQVRWLAFGSVAGASVGLLSSLALTNWQPEAHSAAIGTAVGAAVLAATFLWGLRDLFVRPPGRHRLTSWGTAELTGPGHRGRGPERPDQPVVTAALIDTSAANAGLAEKSDRIIPNHASRSTASGRSRRV
jgi:O-antigen/teichoic acid export membrane protein